MVGSSPNPFTILTKPSIRSQYAPAFFCPGPVTRDAVTDLYGESGKIPKRSASPTLPTGPDVPLAVRRGPQPSERPVCYSTFTTVDHARGVVSKKSAIARAVLTKIHKNVEEFGSFCRISSRLERQPGANRLGRGRPDAWNRLQVFRAVEDGATRLTGQLAAIGDDRPGSRGPDSGQPGQARGRGVVGIDRAVNLDGGTGARSAAGPRRKRKASNCTETHSCCEPNRLHRAGPQTVFVRANMAIHRDV
jgi:hypothetical protein